ncbi:hypothetical protein HDK77DRAFT_316062 [Phyllosticta capitalensis]|uniref:Tat pathway signal sequence domain-containing protein n=1 Tax=Phyllosticta capitalensis TaxID=121624 RepID=A0ABR1YIB3_9PEZI
MRLSFVSLFGLGVGTALAAPQRLNHMDLSNQFNSRFNVHSSRGLPAEGKKGVFFMNRIAPSVSTLWIANADGSNARKLFGNSSTTYDYHAHFSPDGQWITFTSERSGDGNSDIYRVRTNGTGLEKLIATPSFEDAGVISPDGKQLAYVSTANGYRSNIWVMDLATGEARNLTNTPETTGESWSPDGHFRPAWSPDGQWIAFSSDRNTQWIGHGNGTGWEHTQELSVYVIRPDGSDFRQLATKSGYSLGSPNWSPDGERVVYYEITRENTWGAHRPEDVNTVDAQIVSVGFSTGDRIEHTSGSGLRMFPQWISDDNIGYLIKAGDDEGLNYTSGATPFKKTSMRSPSWSPDGKQVVYEVTSFTPNRPMEKKLYSWDGDYEYRFTDVFPQLSNQGRLAITQKQLGNSSVVTMDPDGQNMFLAFDTYTTGEVNASLVVQGLAGAFQPSWSPDGEWISFGLGAWFQERSTQKARVFRTTANGSYYEALTDGTVHSGFPSYSADGRYIVFREWGVRFGLRVIDLTDKSMRYLTNATDNLPYWSPDGEHIVFTRKTNATNFDVCTIRPNGTDLRILTSSGANDAHAVWSHDGRILYNSGMYGFREECAVYDDTFQPYGQIMSMNADGTNKTMLTDSMWEDSMPLYVPNEYLY